MGQQQLFIIVIVTIIAGIATVVAINTMDSSRKNANESAVRQDISMALSDARVYYQRSGMITGNRSFDNFTMGHVRSVDAVNENGYYSVSGAGPSVTISGKGKFNTVSLSVTATITANGMKISWSK